MKKLLVRQLVIAISVLMLFSCNKDDYAESTTQSKIVKRSGECVQSLTFTKEVTRFVKYDGPSADLTPVEQSTLLPKIDVKEIEYCENASGEIKMTIHHNPNLAARTDYEVNTLGAPRKISWKMETVGNQKTLYDDQGNVIETSTFENAPTTFNSILEKYDTPLVSTEAYDAFIATLENNYEFESIDENLCSILMDNDLGKTKVYFDKRCQKPVSTENYDLEGNLIMRKSYLYKVENNRAKLISDTQLSFKEAMDSDQMMSIYKTNTYQYN